MTAALKYRVIWTDPNKLRQMPNSQECNSGRHAMKVARRKKRNPKHKPVVIEARRAGRLEERWTV